MDQVVGDVGQDDRRREADLVEPQQQQRVRGNWPGRDDQDRDRAPVPPGSARYWRIRRRSRPAEPVFPGPGTSTPLHSRNHCDPQQRSDRWSQRFVAGGKAISGPSTAHRYPWPGGTNTRARAIPARRRPTAHRAVRHGLPAQPVDDPPRQDAVPRRRREATTTFPAPPAHYPVATSGRRANRSTYRGPLPKFGQRGRSGGPIRHPASTAPTTAVGAPRTTVKVDGSSGYNSSLAVSCSSKTADTLTLRQPVLRASLTTNTQRRWPRSGARDTLSEIAVTDEFLRGVLQSLGTRCDRRLDLSGGRQCR